MIPPMSAPRNPSATRALPLQMLLAGVLVAGPYMIGPAAQVRPAPSEGDLYSEICTIHGVMKVDGQGQPIAGAGQGNQECCELCVASKPQPTFGAGFSVQAEPGGVTCVRPEAPLLGEGAKLVRRLRAHPYAT
jgi:hypothetical protein